MLGISLWLDFDEFVFMIIWQRCNKKGAVYVYIHIPARIDNGPVYCSFM